MDDATRAGWRREFSMASNVRMDAPSWLWSAVIELVGIHEEAYLEHCRKFALAEAA